MKHLFDKRRPCPDCGEETTHVNGNCIVCTVAQKVARRRVSEHDGE